MFDDLDPLAPPIPEGQFELDVPQETRSVAPPPAEVPEEEAHAFADFGARPDGTLEVVQYALRARARRRELNAGLREAQAQQAKWVERGQVLRLAFAASQGTEPSAPPKSSFLATAAPDALDASIREAEAELGPWQRRAEKHKTQGEVWDHDVRRAEAALKRLQIEMRALGNDPTARAPFAADLESKTKALEVAQTRQKTERLALEEALAEVGVRLDRLRALESQRAEMQQEARDARAEREEAGTHKSEAAIARVNSMLAAGEGGPEALPLLAHAQRENDAARNVARHAAALRTLDIASYEDGSAYAVGAVVACVVLIAALIAVGV